MKTTKRSKMGALSILSAIILIIAVNVESIPAQDAEDVEKMFRQEMNLEVNPVSNSELEEVFLPYVFEIEYTLFKIDDRPSPSQDYTVFATDNSIIRIYQPSTSKPLNYFNKMISPDFRLNEGTASKFKQALITLMEEDFFDDNEVDGETIRKDGNEWYFLTGEFFDNYKGFIATVNNNGAVEKVEYDLKAIPIKE